MCKYKRNFLKCCAPGFARNFRSSKILDKIYGTDDSYQRQCQFMSTFFRNVAYRGFARNFWAMTWGDWESTNWYQK